MKVNSTQSKEKHGKTIRNILKKLSRRDLIKIGGATCFASSTTFLSKVLFGKSLNNNTPGNKTTNRAPVHNSVAKHSGQSRTAGKKPNLLFVFSDQHRWCDLGCYGNSEVQSPNIDAFASKAVKFNNCISNSPLCVPARGSLLTGQMPLQHGAFTNDLPIRPEVESVADVLNRSGYHTGYIGKWHLGGAPRKKPISGRHRLGFEEWKVCNCNHDYLDAYYYDENDSYVKVEGYEPVEQTNLAVEFMQRNSEKPWGLYLSLGPPHDPYFKVPEKYLDLYAEKNLSLRPNVPDDILNYDPGQLPFLLRLGIRFLSDMEPKYDKTDMEHFLKGYYAHITALDEQFGRLIDCLETTGQLENTIVVYTSDHGDMLGSQGLTNKQLPHEESIRVPLLVYWKGTTAHLEQDQLISLVDLPVSLLGLMGLKFDSDTNGADYNQLFMNPNASGAKDCYIFDLVPCHQAAFRGSIAWRGIRTERYTFARKIDDDGWLLFDNETDPFQQHNLIDEPEFNALKLDLRKKVDEYVAKYDELIPFEELIKKNGRVEDWNRSQDMFFLPNIEET